MPPSVYAPKVLRQEVLWVPEDRRTPIQSDVELTAANTRIWTLYGDDPNVKPELPMVPQHNVNAFLEDYVHDWTHERSRGCIRYFSRVSQGSVWILIEHLEQPKRNVRTRRRSKG